MSSVTANGSRPGLHTEQIVAIVISSLALLGATSILLFLVIRRKLRSRNRQQQLERERGPQRRHCSYRYEKANGPVGGVGEKQFQYPSYSNTLPSFKEHAPRAAHLRQPSDQVQLLPPSPPYVRQPSDTTSPRPPSPRPTMSTPPPGTVQQPPPSYIHSNKDVVSPDIYYM